MEKRITQSEVTNFIKQLIEISRVYKVNDEHVIMTADGEVRGVKESKKSNKTLPIVIINDNMECGDYVILNPFVESLARSPEKDFFFKLMSTIPGQLCRAMILSVIEASVSESSEDISFDHLEIISPFIKEMDEKMIKEVKSIKTMEYLMIEYNKKARTAELQTCINFDRFVKSKPKIRKKTWKVISGLMEGFLKVPLSDLEDSYNHKATLIGMQECDATLHVLIKTLEIMEPCIKVLLNRDININLLSHGLANLEKYHSMTKWCIDSASISANKDTDNTPPWTVREVEPEPQPTEQVPVQTIQPSVQSTVVQQPQQVQTIQVKTQPQQPEVIDTSRNSRTVPFPSDVMPQAPQMPMGYQQPQQFGMMPMQQPIQVPGGYDFNKASMIQTQSPVSTMGYQPGSPYGMNMNRYQQVQQPMNYSYTQPGFPNVY